MAPASAVAAATFPVFCKKVRRELPRGVSWVMRTSSWFGTVECVGLGSRQVENACRELRDSPAGTPDWRWVGLSVDYPLPERRCQQVPEQIFLPAMSFPGGSPANAYTHARC